MTSQKMFLSMGLLGLGCAALPVTAPAAQVVLTPAADTCVFEAFPLNNVGGQPSMAAGATANGGGAGRALLRFNVAAQLPAGAIITGARLTLKVVRTPSSPEDSTFALHRILADWGEGNKLGNTGAAASTGEASWLARKAPLTFWSSGGLGAGSDYAATPSATAFVQGLGGYDFASSAKTTADVQAWLDAPAGNFGWLLLSEDESTDATARRFGTREDPANAPRLTIDYEEGGASLHLDPPSVAGGQFKLQFTARSGKSYVVERRGSVEAGAWTAITNVSPQVAGTVVTIGDGLTNGAAFYRVGERSAAR